MKWGLVLVVGLLALSGLARAEEPAAQAKALYERGMAHFQLGEYDDAIARWQEGFRTKPVPEFLYNMGQAYRLSNRPDKALQSYKAYLRMVPDAPNHAEVERHMAAMQALVNKRKPEATPAPAPEPPPVASPSPAAPTPGPATTAPPTAPETTASTTTTNAPAHADLVATAPREKPLTKKAWFWGVVAGGAVVVAGAVVLGVVLGTRDNTKVLGDLTY